MERSPRDRPELVAHDIVTRALHRSGTGDIPGADWIEPLEVLTRSLDREARLHRAGRRAIRRDLVDLLVGRANRAPEPPRRLVVATSPDDVAALARALGDDPAVAPVALEPAFASMTFELRWHVPGFAEWLDAAGTVGSTGFVGAAHPLDDRDPPAPIVRITRPSDEAAAEVAAASVEARRRYSDDVVPEKVERYWSWRLGLAAERAAARPAALEIDRRLLHTDPGAVAESVRRAIDDQS